MSKKVLGHDNNGNRWAKHGLGHQQTRKRIKQALAKNPEDIAVAVRQNAHRGSVLPYELAEHAYQEHLEFGFMDGPW